MGQGVETMLKERPILMSAPMVRACLDGSKTQTRRIIKLAEFGPSETRGYTWTFRDRRGLWNDYRAADFMAECCPYGQPGDRLWVRETWKRHPEYPDAALYRATWGNAETGDRWRPSIHMPRWASRLSLEVTGIRVERLQDISEADAIAEGTRCWICGGPVDGSCDNDCACFHTRREAIPSYRVLWESINGPGSWAANPYVWSISFRRVNA